MRYRDVYGDRDPRAGSGQHRWAALRRRMIRRYPICVQCNRRPSLEVHHVEPVRQNPAKALQWDNCRPVCKECHRRLDSGKVKPRDLPGPKDFDC